jgi:hypothetical protein
MLLRRVFLIVAAINAQLSRRRVLRWIRVRILTPFNVRLTDRIRGRRSVLLAADALGREWEQPMPSRDVR